MIDMPKCKRESPWGLIPTDSTLRQAGIHILIPENINFNLKLGRRDKTHFILIMGSICQKEIIILKIYERKIIL